MESPFFIYLADLRCIDVYLVIAHQLATLSDSNTVESRSISVALRITELFAKSLPVSQRSI